MVCAGKWMQTQSTCIIGVSHDQAFGVSGNGYCTTYLGATITSRKILLNDICLPREGFDEKAKAVNLQFGVFVERLTKVDSKQFHTKSQLNDERL